MTHCNEYEQEISALFDGESDPSAALELLQHVATCPSCGAFVKEMEAFQEAVDEAYPLEAEAPATPVTPLQPSLRTARMPQWAWGLAATLVVSLGLGWGFTALTARMGAGSTDNREMVIRLEENRGNMSQERFIEMVSELLQADRRYQEEMFAVLDAVGVEGGSEDLIFADESPESRSDNGVTDDRTPTTHALN